MSHFACTARPRFTQRERVSTGARAGALGLVMALAGTLALGGCSSLGEMTAAPVQTVAINTNPHGAQCTVTHDGQNIATVSSPNAVKVKQRGGDLLVKCRHPEYETTRMVVKAENRSAGVSDILAASSASQYAKNITIPMRVKGSTPPARSPKRVAATAKKAAEKKAAATAAGATTPAASAAEKKATTPAQPAQPASNASAASGGNATQG